MTPNPKQKGLAVKPTTQKPNTIDTPSLQISQDGYVRVKYSDLENITFHHLESNLDSSAMLFERTSSDKTEIMGHTEWFSKTTPSLSIGWDWKYIPSQSITSYEMVGLPFSNILVQNTYHKDFSDNTSLELLSQFVNSWDWQKVIATYIANKYK